MFEPRPFGPHTLQRLYSSCSGNLVTSAAGLPAGFETQRWLSRAPPPRRQRRGFRRGGCR